MIKITSTTLALVFVALLLLTTTTTTSFISILSFVNAQCNLDTQLQFKTRAAADGMLSYITQAGPEGPTVYFEKPGVNNARPFPPIIISALESIGGPLDLTKDGSLVVCTSDPPLRMGGSSVELNRAAALFDSLTILETLRDGFNYTLTFSMTTSSSTNPQTFSVQSPRLAMVTRSETPNSVRFRNFGYIIRSGSPKAIPINVSLPTFWIEVIGSTGYPVAAGGVNINVAPMLVRDETGERLQAGTLLPPGPFTGAESIEFSGLSYFMPEDAKLQGELTDIGVTFNFTASFGAFVETGRLSLVQEVTRNRFMQFDPIHSFIRYDNEGGTAVLNIPIPAIIIKLFTSQVGFDASDTGTVILASSNQAKLRGAEALVIRGVATFADLTFVDYAPRSAVITFQTDLPGGKTAILYSGSISVTDSAIKASRLRFSTNSKITDNAIEAAKYAVPLDVGTGVFTLPFTSVFFVDSANRYDLTADGIALRLELDPPQNFVTASTLIKRNSDYGTAVWDGIQFTTTQASNTSFSVRIIDPSNIRKPLVSAKVTLLDSSLSVTSQVSPCVYTGWCPLSLKFHNEFGSRSSAVYEEDIPLFTTAGSTIPEIVMSVNDWFGPISDRSTDMNSAAVAPTVKAYTGDSPNTEALLDTTGGANVGRFQNGLYYFSCLRLKSASGLVRINFVVMNPTTGLVYEGFGRPRTGFTTVLASPISSYAIRFAAAGLLQYPGQSTSSVVGVAMPPVIFEVVDSQNKHDAADTSVTVVATTSTGDTTAPVVAQKGLVNFTLVQFLSGAEDPTVTFTVTSSKNPVAGQTMKTGPIRLSTLPIPMYEITFDDARGSTSMFTAPFQSKTVSSWGTADSTITVRLVIRDSAHENSKDSDFLDEITGNVKYTVKIDVLSNEAVFTSGTTVTATTNGIDISTPITGVKPGVSAGGPVFLKYRVSEGPALLIGQTLVAGPISVAGTGASCGGGGGGTSEVIAEIREPLEQFKQEIPTTANRIAQALGVEAPRIIIEPNASQVARTGYKDLIQYEVTKARIAFLDPLPTSTIRKSRSDLANEFLQIRPACDLPQLKLWNVYDTAQDRDCLIQKFIDDIAIAQQCTRSGRAPMCECYENGVVREQGATCADVPELQSHLVTMCMEIRSSCQNSGIQSLCANILVPKKSNMAWAWATLGSVGGVAIAGYVWYRRRLAKQRATLTLTGGAT